MHQNIIMIKNYIYNIIYKKIKKNIEIILFEKFIIKVKI